MKKLSFNILVLKLITLHCTKVWIVILCMCNQVVQLLTDFYSLELRLSSCVHADRYKLLLGLLQDPRNTLLKELISFAREMAITLKHRKH